jgi:hypothetical protein
LSILDDFRANTNVWKVVASSFADTTAERSSVAEIIEMRLKQAAIALAETRDYGRAATNLGLTISDLKHLIEELEERLCLYVFKPGSQPLILTKDGRFLIQAFRKALAQLDQA